MWQDLQNEQQQEAASQQPGSEHNDGIEQEADSQQQVCEEEPEPEADPQPQEAEHSEEQIETGRGNMGFELLMDQVQQMLTIAETWHTTSNHKYMSNIYDGIDSFKLDAVCLMTKIERMVTLERCCIPKDRSKQKQNYFSQHIQQLMEMFILLC